MQEPAEQEKFSEWERKRGQPLDDEFEDVGSENKVGYEPRVFATSNAYTRGLIWWCWKQTSRMRMV